MRAARNERHRSLLTASGSLCSILQWLTILRFSTLDHYRGFLYSPWGFLTETLCFATDSGVLLDPSRRHHANSWRDVEK